MRSISRVTGVSINTVTKLLVDAGTACLAYHDKAVRNVKASKVQCDEIWSFNYAKQKNVPTAKAAPERAGDVWTWTAIDSDSRMILSWLVGDRDAECAVEFLSDLNSRLANRVQLTTDGHSAYLDAVEAVFSDQIDYAMLVKIYGKPPEGEQRYSPSECKGAMARVISGAPDIRHISTSYSERMNLRGIIYLTSTPPGPILHLEVKYTAWGGSRWQVMMGIQNQIMQSRPNARA